MTDGLNHLPHPYEVMADKNRDEWIDRFRAVFGNEGGAQVLIFLAKHWHFFDRGLTTEEWRVQRQCFIDLLICCGNWDGEVADQAMQVLLNQPADVPAGSRIANWFSGLRNIRVKRTMPGDAVRPAGLREMHATERKGKI